MDPVNKTGTLTQLIKSEPDSVNTIRKETRTPLIKSGPGPVHRIRFRYLESDCHPVYKIWTQMQLEVNKIIRL